MRKHNIFTAVLVGSVVLGMVASLVTTKPIVYAAIEQEELSDVSGEAFDKREVLKLCEEIKKLPVMNEFIGNESIGLNNTMSRNKTAKDLSKVTGKGVILVTTDLYKGVIESGHAAIVYSDSIVVEALADCVTLGKNNWSKTKKEYYACVPWDASANDERKAADYCYNMIGKDYNWNYFDVKTRKKFYCSHLVYASYKDLFGIDLNTDTFKTVAGNPIHPYELLTSSKTWVIAHYSYK